MVCRFFGWLVILSSVAGFSHQATAAVERDAEAAKLAAEGKSPELEKKEKGNLAKRAFRFEVPESM